MGLAFFLALIATACDRRNTHLEAPPLAAKTRANDKSLMVVSFNLRFGTADDGPNQWRRRRGRAIKAISLYTPDVIGLQEALRFQIDEIRAALPRYDEFGVGRDDGRDGGEHATILFDRRRFDRLDGSTFWFSDTPDEVCSKSWGNDICRICTWVRLHDRVAGASFYVFNVHLDHKSASSRFRSAELLMQKIRQCRDRDPVLIVGDFNAPEASPTIAALTSTRPRGERADLPPRRVFLDSYRAIHPEAGDVATYHYWTGAKTGAKIDYVFAEDNAFRVIDADIARDRVEGGYPSDHFPVWARLEFAQPSGSASPQN